MVNPSKLKLGKKAGLVEDPRTIHVRRLITRAALAKAPSQMQIGRGVKVDMYDNDRYGDCTCAALGHDFTLEAAQAKRDVPRPTLAEVLAVYAGAAGFRPEDPSTDRGAYLIDILRYVDKNGMGPHQIGAYARVNVKNIAEVKAACFMFGGLYCGAGLPISAQSQVGGIWKPTSGPDAAPYSWGGHCMYLDGFSRDRVGFETWGERQRATWSWFTAYVDEAWALIDPDWLTDTGVTPTGFRRDVLQQALGEL